MKRWAAILVLAAAAGCGGGPEKDPNEGANAPKAGAVTLKAYPVAGDWEPQGVPVKYSAEASQLDVYMGESKGTELRANALDVLLVKTYAPHGWEKAVDKEGRPKRDIRRIRVELFIHQVPVGAGKTFQQWHRGQSITDVGEKAFADQDSVVFLRGSVVVRLVPTGPWEPRSAAAPAVQVGKAIDTWLQGK